MDYKNILTGLLSRKIRENKADTIVFSDRPSVNDDWRNYSWQEFAGFVDDAASAFYGKGLKPGECVAVYSPNRAGALIVDFAAYRLRAVPVSIYSTSSPDQVAYVVNDSKASILFCGGQEQYDNARRIRTFHSGFCHLVAMDDVKIDSDDNPSVSFSCFFNTTEWADEGDWCELCVGGRY